MVAPSPQEQIDFYNNQPQKSVGAGVFILNPRDELLLVEPDYKDGWSLVGGMGERDLSPMGNALQEVREEIGITLDPASLLIAGVRYVHPRDGRNEDMQIFFKTRISDEQSRQIVLQKEEIKAMAYVTEDTIADYADTRRIQAVAAALPYVLLGQGFYMENERVING